jgi:hypothetical protein
MKWLSITLAPVLAAALVAAVGPGLAPAAAADLAGAVGGACEQCEGQAGVCNGYTCTKVEEGKYEEKAGTNITPLVCKAVGTGKDGYTKCETSDKKDCFKYADCKDKDAKTGQCVNCTAKEAPNGEANKQPTKCSTSGGYECQGA